MARLFRNISDVSTDIAVRRHKTLIGEEAYNALAKAIRDATQKDWTTKFVLNRLANAFVWEESTARPLTSGEQYKIYVGSLDFSKAEAAMTRKIRYGGRTEQEQEAASRARQMIYIGQFANISNAILVPSDKGAQFVRVVRVEPGEQGGRGREIPLSPQEALSVLGIEIAKPGEAKTYKRLRRLISGTADVEVDVSGARIVSWNPQLEQKTGITPAKADGIFYVTQELMNSIASQYEASDPALANRIRNLRRFAGSVFTEEGLAKGHVIVLPEGYKGFGPGDIFIPEYKGEIKSTQRRLFSFQIFGVRGDEAEVDKLSFMNAAYYITEPTKRVSTIIESAVRGSRALFDPNRIQSRVLERVERIISLNENNRWDINLMALGGVSPLFTQYGARTTLHEHLPLPFFMEESQRKDITSGRYKLDLENVFSLELTNAAVFVHKNKRFEEFIRNLPKGYAYADVATGSLYVSAHDYPETAARLGGGDQDDRLLIYANPSGQAIIQRQPSDFGEFETFKIINAPQLRRMGFIKPDTQYQIMRLQMNAINPIFKEFEVDELGSYDEARIINRVLAGLNVNWQSPHGRDLLNLFYALEKEGRLGAYVNSIMAVSAAMGRGITRPMVRMEELIDSTVKDLSKDTIQAKAFIDFIQGEDEGIAPALAAVSYVAAGKLKSELFQRNQRVRAQIPPNLWGLSKIDVLYKVNQIALDYINLIGSDPERSARSRMIVPRADIYSAPARWYELIPYKRETGEDRSFFFADYNAIFNKVSGWFRADYQAEMMGGYSNGPSIPQDVMQSMQGFQAAILSEAKQRDRQDVISRYSDIDFNEKFETINVLFAKKVFDAINTYLEKNNRQKITPYQFVTGEFEMDENIAKGIAAHLLYPYSNPEDWKLSNEMFFNKYMTNVMLRALEAAGLSKPGMTLDEIKQSFAEKGTFTFYVFKGGEEDLSRFVGGTATLFYKTGAGGITSVNLKLSKQLESGETIEKEVTLPMDIASPIWDIKGGKVVFAKGKTQTAPFAAITIEPEYKTQEDYRKWELLDTDPFEAVKQYAQNPVEITQQYLYHLSPQDMIKFNVAKEIMSRGKEVRGLFKEYKPISDWLSDPLGSPFPQEEVERAVQSGLITREEAAELEKFKNILPKLAPYFEPTSGRIYGRLAITTPQELSDPNSQTSISVRQLLEQQRQQSKTDIRIKEINTYGSILNGEVSVEEGVIQLAREYGLTVNVFYSETFKRNKRKSYEGVTVNYIQVPDAKALNTSRALIASAHIIAGSRIPVINKTAAEVTDTEQLREQLAQNPDFENVYGVLLPYTTQSQQPQMVTIHEVQDAPYTINFADAPISTTIFDLERKRAEAVRNVIAPSRKLPWEERAPSSRVQARTTVQAQTQTTTRAQTNAQAPTQQATAPTQQQQQAAAPAQQQQTQPQQPAQSGTATGQTSRANPLEGRMYALTPENIGTIQEALNWALENAEQTRRSMMERGTLSEDMQAAFEEVTGGYRSALEAMRSGRPLASKNLEYVQRALQKRLENLRTSGASREDIRNMEKLIGTVSAMLTNVRKEEGRAAQQGATQAQATQAQSQQTAQTQAAQAQSQQTTGRQVSEAQQTYQRTGASQQRGGIVGFNEIVSALEYAIQRAESTKESMQREGKLTPNMLLTYEQYRRGYQSALQTIRSNQPFTQEQLTYVTQAITRKIEQLQSSGAPSSEIEKYQALLNTMNILQGGGNAGIREASQQTSRQQTQGGGGGQEPPEPPSTVSAVPAPEEPSQPQPSANRGLTRNEIKLMEETLGYAIQRANRLRAEALKNRNADRQKIQSQYQERVSQYSAAINAIKRGAALTPENVNAMILATQYRLADLRSQQNPQRPNQGIDQQIQSLQGILGILENMSRAMQPAQASQSEEDFDINDIEQPIPESYRAQSEPVNATEDQVENIQEQQDNEPQPINEEPQLEAASEELANQVAASTDTQANAESQPMTLGGEDDLEPRAAIDQYIDAIAYAVGQEVNEKAEQIQTILQVGNVDPIQKANSIGRFELEINKLNRILQDIQSGRGLTGSQLEKLSEIIRKHSGIAISQLAEVENKEDFASNVVGPLMMSENYIMQKQYEVGKASEKLRLAKTAELLDAIFTFGPSREASDPQAARKARIDKVLRELIDEANYVHPLAIKKIAENINLLEEQFELAKDNFGAFAGKSKAELDYLRDLAYSYKNDRYAARDRRAFLHQIIFDAYMEGNYEGRGRGSSHFRAEDIIYSLLPASTLQSDIDIAGHVASAIFDQRDQLSESDYAAALSLAKRILTSGVENLDIESAGSVVRILGDYINAIGTSGEGDSREIISVKEAINILNRHIQRRHERQESGTQQQLADQEEVVPESRASATEIAAQSDVAAQSAGDNEPRSPDERFRLLSFLTDDLHSISLSVLEDEIRESEIYLEELENNPHFGDSDDLQNEHAIYSKLVEDYRSALEAIRERDKPIETKTVNLLMQALTNWRSRWDIKLSEARRAGDEIGVMLAREKIARADAVLSHIDTNYENSQLIPTSTKEYDERGRLLSGFDENDYKAAAGILRREIEEKEARLVSLEEDIVSESSSELQEEYERLTSEVEDYRLALHEIESGGPISTDSVRAIERAASKQKAEAAYEYSMFANAGNEQGKEEARRKRYEATRILSRIETKRLELGVFDDEEADEIVDTGQQPEVTASEQQPEAIEASSESTAQVQAASEETVVAESQSVTQEQQPESMAQVNAEPAETTEQQTPTQQQEEQSSGAGTPGQPRRILFGANRNPRFSTADEQLVNYSVDQLLRWPDQFDVYFDTSDFATSMIRKLAEQKQAGNQAAASLLERAKVIVTAKSFETEMGQRALEAISEAGITSDQFVTADLFRVEREGQEEAFESIAEIMRTASDEGVRDFVISTGANDPDTVLSILVHRFGKNQSLPVGTPEEERQAFEGLSAGIYISAQMAASQGGNVNLTLGTNERGPVRVRIRPEEQITNADGTPRVDRRGLPMYRFTVEVFRQDRRGRQYSEAIVRTGRVADAGQQYVRRRGERVAAQTTTEGAAQSQQTARGGARAQETVQRAEHAPANLTEEAIEEIRQLPIPERMGAFYSRLSPDAEQQQFNTGRSGRTPTAEQREYITRIMSGVAEGRRMIASLHTGWGKTSIIGAITSMGQERAAAQAGVRSRLNIVITPNTALSEELTKVLREQYGVNAIKHVADPGLRSELIPDWEERNRQYQAYRRQVFSSLNQMVWQNKDLTLIMTPEAFSNFSLSQVGRFAIWSMLDRGVNVIVDEAQEITRETGRPFHLIREGIENIEAEFARVSSEAKVGVALVGGTMTDPVLSAISQFFGVSEEDILKKRLPLSYLSKSIEPVVESETISNRVLHRVRTAFEEGKDSILVFGGRIQDIHDITNKLQSELGEDVVVKYFHGGIIPNTADEENIGRKMSLEERREVQELMENRQAREQGKKYVFVASDIAQLGLNPDVNEVVVAGDYLAFGDLLQKGARIRPRRDEQGNILPNVISGSFSMLVNPKRIIDIGNRLQLQAQDQNVLQTVFTEIYRKLQEEFENLDPNWQIAGEQMENIASQVIDDFNRARREVNPNAQTISRFAAGAMLRAMRESGLLSMHLVSEPVSEEQRRQLEQMAASGFIEPGSEPPKHLAFRLEDVTNPVEHAQNSNIYVNPSNPNETISFVEYLSKLVEGRGREIKATGEFFRNILISRSAENREAMWQKAEAAFFRGDVQGLEDYVYQQMPRELAKEYVDEVKRSIRSFQENTENLSDLTESFARLKKEIDELTEHYAQAGSEFKNAAITQLSEMLQTDLGNENIARIAGLGEIASISVGNEGLTLMSTGGQFADLPIARPEATAGIGGTFYALGRVSSLGTEDFERLRFASTGGGGGGRFGGFGGGGGGGDYIPRRGGFWSTGLGPLVYAPYLLNRFARMLIAPIVAEGESYGELATSYLGLQYQSTSPSFLHQFAGRMEATAIRRGAALYPAIEPFDRIKEWASRRPGLVIAGSSLNVGAEALAGMFIATQSVSFFGGQVADVLFKNAAEIAQTQLNRGLITEQALKSMTREELVSRYLGPSAATAFSLMSGLAVKIAPLMLTWGLPIAATVAAGWGLYAASQYQEQQFLNSFQVYEKGTGRVLTQDELKERLGPFTYAQLVATQGGVRRSPKGFAMSPVQLPGDLAVRKTLVGDVAEYATKLAEQYGYFQKGGPDAVANALYFLTSETGRKVGDKGIESALAEILPRALLEGRDPIKITEEAFGYAEFFAPKGTNEFFYHMAQFAKMSPRERSAQMRTLGIYGSRASAFQDLFGTEGEFLRFAQQMRFSASGEQIAQQVRRIYEMYAPQNQPFAANAPSTLDIGYFNQQALQYLASETSPLSPYTAGIAVSLAGQYMQAGLLSPEHYPIASALFGKFLSQFNLQQQSLIEQIVGGDMRAYSYAFWYQPDILESLGLTVTPFAQATYQSTTAEEIGEKLSRRTLPPPKRHPADKPAIRDIDAIRTPPPSREVELLQPPFRFAAGYSSDVGIGAEITRQRIASSPLVSSDVGVRAFMLESEPGAELRNMRNWQESFQRKEQEPATQPFGEFVEKRTIKGRKTYPEGGASIIVAGSAEEETAQQPMSVNAMSRLLYDMYGRPVYQGVTGYQWGQILTQMSMAGMPVPAQYAGGFPTLQAFKQAYGFRSDFAARAFYTMPADQAQFMIYDRVRSLQSDIADLQLGSIGLAYSHAVQTFAITDQMRELQYKSRMADFASQRRRMNLSWSYQQGMLDIQGRRLGLQEWYTTQSIALQERQMQFNWRQQDWMRAWARDVELMQRGWAREAFSFGQSVRALQFSWKMEDYDEAIRASHGRERRKLIQQKERETTMYNLEEERAQKEMRQQEELWKKEDERFEKEKEFIEEARKMEAESFELNKRYRLEMMALDREAFELQKNYQEEIHQLDIKDFERKKKEFQEMWELETQKYEADKQYQLASLGIQAEIAQKQKEINDLLSDQNTYFGRNEEIWGKIAGYIEMMNRYKPDEQLKMFSQIMSLINAIPQQKLESLIMLFYYIGTISSIPTKIFGSK